MKLKTSLTLAAAVAALSASVATASPLDKIALTYGYDNFEADTRGADGLWVRGETSVQLGDFDIELGVTHGDALGDEPATTFSVAPKMDLGRGFTGGAFVDVSKSDDFLDSEANHAGITLDYTRGAVTVSNFLGTGDWEQLGFASTTEVYGTAVTFDAPGAFDFGGSYRAEIFETGSAREVGWQVGYDMTEHDIPGYFQFGYSALESMREDGEKVAVSYSIPFGKDAKTEGFAKSHEHSVGYSYGFMSDK